MEHGQAHRGSPKHMHAALHAHPNSAPPAYGLQAPTRAGGAAPAPRTPPPRPPAAQRTCRRPPPGGRIGRAAQTWGATAGAPTAARCGRRPQPAGRNRSGRARHRVRQGARRGGDLNSSLAASSEPAKPRAAHASSSGPCKQRIAPSSTRASGAGLRSCRGRWTARLRGGADDGRRGRWSQVARWQSGSACCPRALHPP